MQVAEDGHLEGALNSHGELPDRRGRGGTCLYIDMAYSLAELRQRAHFQFFEARHSGGYFEKVIGLHPLADRMQQLSMPRSSGKISATRRILSRLSLPHLDFLQSSPPSMSSSRNVGCSSTSRGSSETSMSR